MIRAIGRALLWVLCGVAGSLSILIVTNGVLDLRDYPRIQSGGQVFTDFWDRGYVRATGTWVFEDDTKQAFPRQTTEIECYRDEKECRSAQAEIASNMLTVHSDRFPIASWDSQSIVYVSRDPMCVSYTYTVSRSTQRITGQRQPKPSSSSNASCAPFEQRTFNLSLRDGFLVWQQLQSDNQKMILPIMYATLGVWWAFIIYRMSRSVRRAAAIGRVAAS
ncbi:hypothetical protein [Bradyrhizobium neotropicale]|uniref:hypothetical protein n=1 Tax=Bradyrhizobium neotropicale TaxID=1497615 RepID=UPI001AD77257|nr:hypothetical protein [Bradyrhizobium neotropicale]MBO4225350.1 hypothetical protein [Bradyrhizobium neotropicale]